MQSSDKANDTVAANDQVAAAYVIPCDNSHVAPDTAFAAGPPLISNFATSTVQHATHTQKPMFTGHFVQRTTRTHVHNVNPAPAHPTVAVPPTPTISMKSGQETARDIMTELLADNAAFVAGKAASHSSQSALDVRTNLAVNGQAPVAAIVACADSRVAPEIAFAAGVGRLFVIRNAGNVVTEQDVLGSLEYAVNHLNVPLVIVLGHTKCGAVTAAIGMAKDGIPASHASPLGGHVGVIADVVKGDVGAPEEVSKGISTNVKHGVDALKAASSPISSAFNGGNIDIVGAVYDIQSGVVSVVS